MSPDSVSVSPVQSARELKNIKERGGGGRERRGGRQDVGGLNAAKAEGSHRSQYARHWT